MSGCWASRAVAALSIAATLIAAPYAHAGSSGLVTVKTHDGRSHRVRIDENGITVSRTSADSESSRVEVGGDFDAGAIVVHGNGNGTGIVRLFSDAVVGPGERVDGDVVAVFGSVRVEGEVEGSAVAVFGSLDLRRNSLVRGDAVAVGGGLKQSDGSKVEGQSVQVGFLPLTLGLPGLPVVLVTIAFAWLVSLFFGWVAAALFPARLARIAVTSSRRTAASLLLGVASGPMVCMGTLLLLVTVVGIPIAVLLPVVYVAVLYAGQIAATYVLGCKLTRRRLGAGGATAALASGSLLVASIFGFGAILWETPGVVRTVALFLMLLGTLLLVGLSAIGTGAFMLSRAGSRPTDIDGPAPGDAPSATPVTDPVASA